VIEGIHKHLLSELDRAGRSDTVFVVAGVAFNLLVLFINWAQSTTVLNRYGEIQTDTIIIFGIFIVGALVVSFACLLTLLNSRKICCKCHDSLLLIYEDSEVSKYMPDGMSNLGGRRFILSFIVVAGTGLLAISVPLISMLLS